MPKKLIKRFLPDAHKVRDHKHLQMFGKALHSPNLWHLNRKSVPAAFAIGLFMAFVPMPFQMIPAAALAIYFRANIIISVALVWVSNPITIPPLMYFCYVIGTWMIGRQPNDIEISLSLQWFKTEMALIWKPFLLGTFSVGTVLALTGYFGIQALWRMHVVREWKKRKERRIKHQ